MLTFDKFTGLNNVLPQERMAESDLVEAMNVDIADDGQLLRRQGYTLAIPDCHRNLFEHGKRLLCTLPNGALAGIKDGVTTTIHPSIGTDDRVWFAPLPDGRITFSNGLIAGITNGLTYTGLGVPVPESGGAFTSVLGSLQPGLYQWLLSHVRLSDGLEGGAVHGGTMDITEGGLLLTGFPVPDGHKTRVYLTGANGDEFFLAGETAAPAFSFVGVNDDLVVPCRTQHLVPMPVGILGTFWRTRLLVAVGDVLVASRANQWELHDPRKDVKRFGSAITLIQPVHDGVYVGTEDELVFLSGTDFDGLAMVKSIPGRVVLGSGVTVASKAIGDGAGAGDAMICIANSEICAGKASGAVSVMTDGRYKVPDTINEVFAAFREVRGIPQYLATPA